MPTAYDPDTLGFRQSRHMLHRCDLWQPAYPVGTAGGEATTWTLVLTAVPYSLKRKSRTNEITDLGQMESEERRTASEARFPEDVPVGNDWLIVDQTLNEAGGQSFNFGRGWAVKADPITVATVDTVRTPGQVTAEVTALAVLPAVVKAYYA